MKKLFFILPILVFFSFTANAETIGDVNGDDKVNLKETIYSLQVVAGLKTTDIEQINLTVESVFGSNLLGLGTIIHWIEERIATLSKNRVTMTVTNLSSSSEQVLDRVSDGSIQAAFSFAGYNTDAIPAAELFGSFPFGPEPGEYLAWLWYGNGLDLWQQIYDDAGFNVKILPCGIMTAETGGWYKDEINTSADFNGLKMRACGLAAMVFQKLGATTECYGGGQIVGKFNDGSIDAAEFSTPAIDALIDLPSVATYNYFPGFHQKSTVLEFIINKDIWNGLAPNQQMALEMSCIAATADSFAYNESIQAQYIINNENNGVTNAYFPEDVLDALKTASDQVMAEQSAGDETFQTVWNAYSQFHSTYSAWSNLNAFPSQ